MSEKLGIDYSTINMDKLRLLPKYNKPPTYQISRSMGSGCAGDPPGFPTYYIQHIYTQHGNSPHRGPTSLICGHVIQEERHYGSWDEEHEKFMKLMFKLWKPLDIDNPRTRAWIISTYGTYKHCYYDPFKKTHEQDHMIIWPVPDYKLQSFHDDIRFCNAWRITEKKRIELENKYVISEAKKIAIPKHHAAAIYIQKFYPDYVPNLDLIETPQRSTGTWWETLSRRPLPDECPGEPRWEPPHKHPMNGTWCQVCGWEEGEGK
jgi:hypothetical protein